MSGEAQSKLADIRSRRERNTTPRGEDVDYLLSEVGRLREQLDAARQALKEIDWNPGGARRIALAALGVEAS